MINVEIIDLTSRGITFPSNRVGMVIAQPYLSLTSVEPYQCTEQSKAYQLEMLADTLAVARAARHGEPKTHFTVFPEYSIPGLDGIVLVESALSATDWPTGTVVIGGTDGLSKADFETIVGEPRTHLDIVNNCVDRVGQNEWINCEIIWVKGIDGIIERWLQPKLCPAGLELNVQHEDMFHGNSVFVFKGLFDNGTQYHFSSLVCFDWISEPYNQKAWHWVLAALQAHVAPGELSLSWFFVIQRNPKPSHDTFLLEVREFFNQTLFQNVRRERTCLIFANGAGNSVPGRVDEYGGTSLIFSRHTQFDDPTCHATFSNGGQMFRSSTLLSIFRDIYFRERGACIHSFAQVNPASLVAGPAGRKYAVENPFVFPFHGVIDPRAPSAPVPACVKWLNDELDLLPKLTANNATVLAPQSDTVHQQIATELRTITSQFISNKMKLASSKSKDKNADQWERIEVEALEHLVHTLDIIALGFASLTVSNDSAHANVVINDQRVDLLAIRGVSHEDCIEHSKRFLSSPRRQVLLISRDNDNNPWRQRFGSILQPATQQLGLERNITDTTSGSLHLGYRKLLDIFQQATTQTDIQGAINAELGA
jgi:hypothetical protein